MKKLYVKLTLAVAAFLAAAVMIVSVSYAWMTLSESPAANGLSVTIGGGNTILLAADLTATVKNADGTEQVVHYPAAFSSNLNFAAYDSYGYLNELGGLSPVSTADGEYWILPTYSENGELAPIDSFTVDDTLAEANRSDGSYAYLDFWLVSPGSDYNVRVSMDSKLQQGSYLIELPSAEATDDGYTLTQPQQVAAASARVGFLVNSDTSADGDLLAYSQSDGYEERYRTLLGVYRQPDEEVDPTRTSGFTIYEPNADLHPNDAAEDGAYTVTHPLRYDPSDRHIEEAERVDNLAVQLASAWQTTGDATALRLEQIFQAAIAGKNGLTAQSAQEYFYRDYLQGQVEAYLSAGRFVQDSEALTASAEDGTVSSEHLQTLKTAGAADGAVIVKLKRNTPQRVRMFIWLEGQDIDCRSSGTVRASELALKIELAGSTK